MVALYTNTMFALLSTALVAGSALADCPVEGPINSGNSPYWVGEMTIASERTFKIKNYRITTEYDLFWYGLKTNNENVKLYDVEQTRSGKNDDTNNEWTNGVAQDAVFTIKQGESLADYKEIRLWCVMAGGSYGVGRYDPAELTITSDSCTVGVVVEPEPEPETGNNSTTNGTTTTNSTTFPPTNQPTNENSASATVASIAVVSALVAGTTALL